MLQGARDVEFHCGKIGGVKDDGLRGERFVETSLESQSEGPSIKIRECGDIWEASDDMQELGLVFDDHLIVRAMDHDIIALRTKSLGAVVLCVSRITKTGTALALIPSVVIEEIESLSELIVAVIELHIAIGQRLNEEASAVTRAVSRTSRSLT